MMLPHDEYKKYLDLILSMTVEAKQEGITQETYIANLEIVLYNLKGESWANATIATIARSD